MSYHSLKDLSPEARKKLEEDRASKKPTYDSLLAEFGYYYGWEGVRDCLEGNIEASTFNRLLREGRKFYALRRAQRFQDMVEARNISRTSEFKDHIRMILGD